MQRLKYKNTKEAIPYEFVYDDGIFEGRNGVFSKAYPLGDINFDTASSEEQLRIYGDYRDMLTGLDDNTSCQIVIHNMRENSKVDLLSKVSYKPLRDALTNFRSSTNAMIRDRLHKSKNGLRQQKYVIISTKSHDTLKAKTTIDNSGSNIQNAIRRISQRLTCVPMTSTERLRSLFDIYNQDGENTFGNARNKEGETYLSFKFLAKQGRTTKDEIAPSGLDFTEATYFRIGRCYGRSMFMEKYAPSMTSEYLQNLANINCPSLISIHYTPISLSKVIKMVKNNIMALDAEAEAKNGMASESLKRARSGSADLMEDLVNRKQKAYHLTLIVTVFADTLDKLNEYTKQVTTIGTNKQAPLRTLFGRQMEGFNSSLPLGQCFINEKKLLTTESAAIFLPFTSLELEQLNGINYGTNLISGNQIFYNKLTNKNGNSLIIAKSGGGKSALAKIEILQILLRSKKNYVHVVDPQGEYVEFAQKLGGQVITVAPNSNKYLNPFDMDVSFDGDNDPLQEKCDYILGMITIMQQGKPLDSRESSVVDRAVKNIYRGYIEHMEARRARNKEITKDRDEESLPTLRDLYRELKDQDDRDSENIAKSIERFAKGGMQIFNNRTNVDTSGRLIVYDIHRLGSGTKSLGLYVCLNELKNAAIENRKNDNWTFMYIDEMQSVMDSETSTRPLANLWQTVRKFNGIPTGILQNTTGLMSSEEGLSILNNTNTMFILDVGSTDRTNLSDYLRLSDTEADYISNVERGHGLLCAGSLRVPFDNYIDQEKYPDIYDLIKTSSRIDD